MKNTVAIVKYNAGNIGSVGNALDRLGVQWLVTDQETEIKTAAKVIFPGVGEASTTMENLRKSGLAELIPQLQQPVLGICLGMQLMCSWSEEGNTEGLGIFPERVLRFRIQEKVPHMGWNSLTENRHPLLYNLPKPSWFYFVHSFYAEIGPSTVGIARHGIDFAAFLHRENFYAAQFHPEKSGATGAQFLKNFLEL